MSETFRFDDRVVVVTDAATELGRHCALEFSRRGAKLVVNDPGGETVDQLVAEIQAAGGEAVPGYCTLENGAAIIRTAQDNFDRVDVVVNNVGIIRDSSLAEVTLEDWDRVYRVHALGSYRVIRAAWPLMLEQGYGRIVNTVSTASIYGKPGQANNAFARGGLIGLSFTLAQEGAENGIKVNAVAPAAGSTQEAVNVGLLTSLVVRLSAEESHENGSLFGVGAGRLAKLHWKYGRGARFGPDQELTAETIDAVWAQIG